ncbi:MAG: hypothetical protein IH989_02180 [Planctomycetes bacterium]|nr:hypothetical protein [Planctomycetota bacterium]
MTYQGKVVNGVVVLENGAKLPDGTAVRVEPVLSASEEEAAAEALSKKLLDLAGSAGPGLPSDLARNHDHYLHGGPKH